jgi:hypothetical protein
MRTKLSDAPIEDLAQELLGGIPQDDAPTEFPEVPTPLTASKEIRDALKVLSANFNRVTPEGRRSWTDDETTALGTELSAIQQVAKLITAREKQIKELARIHQDVEAEEQGRAFPKDVYLNGNLVASATPRDANGHYILAAPEVSQDTPVPGTTLRFSNQFVTGKITRDLGAIDRAFAAGEIDERTYKACTVVKRVPDPDRIRTYVLRSGDASLLARIVKRGRNSCSMYLRPLKKN